LRNRSNYNNGYDDNAIKLTALYQWVWNIDGGFNWYAGVGGGVGTTLSLMVINTVILLYLQLEYLGIEYNFDIPLSL
jgi:hypothetical protein